MTKKYTYIGFVGSRKISKGDAMPVIRDYMDWVLNEFGKDITIVSGGAKGIDTFSIEEAKKRGIRTLVYLPKYEEYKIKYNKIYFERNQRIVDRCDILCAFPYQKKGGTMNTIKLFKKKYNDITRRKLNVYYFR